MIFKEENEVIQFCSMNYPSSMVISLSLFELEDAELYLMENRVYDLIPEVYVVNGEMG